MTSNRYEPISGEHWTIEQYKYWKGLGKTCWTRHPGSFCSKSWDDMNEIRKEFEKVDPSILLRVTKWSML